jgi:hypothetical protein
VLVGGFVVGRQAFVHREGLVGASIAGLAPALRVPWPWRPFSDDEEAFEWIGHSAAARVRAEVRAIVEPLAPLNTVDTCSCELACDDASCQALWNTYVSCLVSACQSQCP